MLAVGTVHGLAKVVCELQFQTGTFEALSLNITVLDIFLLSKITEMWHILPR